MQTENKYIQGKEAFYDEDKEMFYCHVGLNKPGMPLICSAWGTTEEMAISRASEIIIALDNCPSVDKERLRLTYLEDVESDWEKGLLDKDKYDSLKVYYKKHF